MNTVGAQREIPEFSITLFSDLMAYRVEANSVEDFLDRFCKPERFQQELYVGLIRSYTADCAYYGVCYLRFDESNTGRRVAYFATGYDRPILTLFHRTRFGTYARGTISNMSRHIAGVFSFLLPIDELVTAAEFADLIDTHCDKGNAKAQEMTDYLRNLEELW